MPKKRKSNTTLGRHFFANVPFYFIIFFLTQRLFHIDAPVSHNTWLSSAQSALLISEEQRVCNSAASGGVVFPLPPRLIAFTTQT